MAATTLLPTTFAPSGMDTRNTLIEDTPQVSVRRAAPQHLQRTAITSPMSDNFPTPKAATTFASPASSEIDSDTQSIFSKASPRSFDDMYDISEESEGEELPIKLSLSVKRRVGANQSRYPSIIIPSPGQWPTIEKLRSATALSPPANITLSPAVLARMNGRVLQVPSTSSAPSLDGSLTSEELALSSCPSTPDIQQRGDDDTWEAPIQLDPSAFHLLQQINGEEDNEHIETVIEVPAEAISEMREIVESPPVTGRFTLNTKDLPRSDNPEDEFSALSVPSPGGFFASLDSSVSTAWTRASEVVPNTSTATEFYGVPFRSNSSSALPTSTATSFYNLPWDSRPDNPVEQTVTVPESQNDEPLTARKVFSPTETIHEVDEIDETYDSNLQQTASVNIDRTALWLSAQSNYMKAICEDDQDVTDSFKHIQDAVPRTPDQASPRSTGSSPGKKSVRFADHSTSCELKSRGSLIHDGTFWEGWRHIERSQRARDVFQQRQVRAEAEHVRRSSCAKQHVRQLQGKFEINCGPERPSPHRPISTFIDTTVDEEKKQLLGQVERERQALEQMQSSSWHTQAQKAVNGGSLLTSPIVQSFKGRKDVRILDLAGQVHCSWAWSVAADHPKASVYTTVSSDAEAHVADSTVEGPTNHFVVAAPNLWELPFPDNHFDVISARNLYAHLKNIWPQGQAADEWDLTLRECVRCLKPGGYLEYDLLDAELIHPTPASQALGVEFAFSLKTRGYEPSAGKSFLPRLKRAGFGSIKRAWMVLPVAEVLPRWTDCAKTGNDPSKERTIGPNGEVCMYEPALMGSTKDIRAMTGLIGARSWEAWMVKLNSEMGRNEERCIEGVAKAIEEAGRANAGWRCLVGWAKKE